MSGPIYCEDVGRGRPVLAIHGLGGGAHFFGGLAKRVQDDCRLIAVDLPGTGRSSGDAIAMDRWVADLGSFVDEHIAEPVVVLGHSMGTMIALHAWGAWPRLIRGLIVVGGLPQVRPVIRQRLEDRLTALEHAHDLTGWGPKVSPGNFSPATLRDHPELVALFERIFETQPVETYRRCLQALLEADERDVAAAVTVPVLAVTGADDQYAPPADVAEFISAIAAPCRLEVLERCGHLPFFERPQAFADLVKSFARTC